jgi:hypothetical protein
LLNSPAAALARGGRVPGQASQNTSHSTTGQRRGGHRTYDHMAEICRNLQPQQMCRPTNVSVASPSTRGHSPGHGPDPAAHSVGDGRWPSLFHRPLHAAKPAMHSATVQPSGHSMGMAYGACLGFQRGRQCTGHRSTPPPCAAHNQSLCLRHVLGQVGQAVRRGRLIVSLCILLWQDVLKKLSSVNTLQEGRPETCSNMARSRRTSEYMSTTSTTNSAPNRTNLNARLRFHETQRTRD